MKLTGFSFPFSRILLPTNALRAVIFGVVMLLGLGFESTANADYLVSDFFGNQVLRFNESDGSLIGSHVSSGSGGLDGAVGMLFNGAGDFLVASQNTNQVLRYDGTSGSFLGVFADTDMMGPSHMALDSTTGDLLVSNFTGDSITRFDSNGNSLGGFTSGGPALAGVTSFAFAQNGDLYAGSYNSGEVFVYDSTGVYVSTFASGLAGTSGLRFDGSDLWVASLLTSEIVKYDAAGTEILRFSTGSTGTSGVGTFPSATYESPFGSDEVLVSLTGEAGVSRYATNAGANPTPIEYIGGFDPTTGFPYSLQSASQVLRVASPVPEPTALLPMALAGCLFFRRRRN